MAAPRFPAAAATSSISSSSSSGSSSSTRPDHHASTTLQPSSKLTPLRSSALTHDMGQNESKQALATSPSSQKSFYIAASTGSKLKRAFARRKKSEDVVIESQPRQKAPRQLKPKDVPPSPPPKPVALQVPKKPVPITPASRGSVIPVTPGISSAVNFMMVQEAKATKDSAKPADSDHDSKETWRRSDATITRAPTRSSRPVSMAESLQSTHTVTPVNKRLSALVNDGDLAEEEEDRRASRTKHRSKSLNAGPSQPPVVSPKLSLEAAPPLAPSMSRETPTLTRAAASGIIAPSSSGLQSTSNNIRGRLAAWTATTNSTPTPGSHPDIQARSRQPAVSLSASLGPAAGLAKRAVEKMGRAWGGFGSNNSSSPAPSSFSSADHALVRTNSNQSGGKGPKHRRTPNSASSAWSVNSSNNSSSVSDLDAFAPPPEPHLGKCMRGPLRVSNGVGVGGVVFGVNLRLVVSETAVAGSRPVEVEDVTHPLSARLEQRRVPALVVRCAQHLLLWGVQEEGLFRVSGRPSHTSKLRSEFDSGADYDMSECTPGDLDPHAVASVFKAFLRELPDPILTQGLVPYFEAALAQENSLEQERNPRPKVPAGPSLPSGPRNGQMMRKPPSLSTLAQPNFNSLRAPSQYLVNALRSLVRQLPPENRDLLRTVTDLIRTTAKNSRETKMPLSNLLLVFCPSLNMNPPLLRVLCEAQGVWEEEVVDIKRESLGVLDIRAPPTPEPVVAEKETAESPLPSPTRPRSPGARSKRAYPAAVYVDDDHTDGSSLAQILADRVAQYNSPSDVSSVSTSEDTSIAPRLDASSPLLSSGLSLAHVPLEKESDVESVHLQLHSPVQFPTIVNHSPVTPVSATRPIPTLSLPSLSLSPKADHNSPGSAPPSPFRRLKKPSLHLLFSKRSASPLTPSPTGGFPIISGPYLQPPKAASESSLSTPVSAVTASQGSPLSLPPVLDTPIESSSLREGLGIGDSPEPEVSDEDLSDDELPLPVLGQTPIADMYRTPSSSSLAVNHLRAQPTRKVSQASIASSASNRLGILNGDEEDWTQSVLLAADVDWRTQGP
ncbi:hypothetical protein C8F01DRAFT_1103593 [Mycena amicta]|nr:hypothetical protein C8F01DRAFT_1103593 [Mycena amicta]